MQVLCPSLLVARGCACASRPTFASPCMPTYVGFLVPPSSTQRSAVLCVEYICDDLAIPHPPCLSGSCRVQEAARVSSSVRAEPSCFAYRLSVVATRYRATDLDYANHDSVCVNRSNPKNVTLRRLMVAMPNRYKQVGLMARNTDCCQISKPSFVKSND